MNTLEEHNVYFIFDRCVALAACYCQQVSQELSLRSTDMNYHFYDFPSMSNQTNAMNEFIINALYIIQLSTSNMTTIEEYNIHIGIHRVCMAVGFSHNALQGKLLYHFYDFYDFPCM